MSYVVLSKHFRNSQTDHKNLSNYDGKFMILQQNILNQNEIIDRKPIMARHIWQSLTKLSCLNYKIYCFT